MYDVIIIGGGPAGLTAGIYAARYKLNAIIFSKNMGGMASTAYKICNFPSHTEIKGFELMQKITKQVNDLGVEIVYDEVIKIEGKNNNFKVSTKKNKYECKKIIFAAGTKRLRLNIPGEGKFSGRGVSYCTTCDAPLYKNKTVCVAGGGDSALASALLLSEFASKIYVVYRGEKFKAEPTWIELVKKNKKIEILFNEEITEITGSEKVEEIMLKSGKKIKVEGVFIEAGSVSETGLLENLKVKLNEKGYIISDKSMRTNIKGIFSAGDINDNNLKQIIVSCGEGAIAAYSAYEEIRKEMG